MVIKLNNISSKIFLLNHEDVAVFNSGIHFPRSQFVKIDIPNDVSYVWVPFTMEFQEDNTRVNQCNPEAYGRKGTDFTVDSLQNSSSTVSFMLKDNLWL